MTGGTGAPLLGPRKTPESRSTGPRRSSGRLEGSLRELEEALPEASEPSARSSRVLPGSTKRRVGPTLAGPPGRAARAPSSGPRGPESGSSGEAARRRGESESTPQSGAPELWDRSRGASGERRDLPGPERSASEPWPRLPRGPKPGPWALRRGPQGPAVAGREDSRIGNAWWGRSTAF